MICFLTPWCSYASNPLDGDMMTLRVVTSLTWTQKMHNRSEDSWTYNVKQLTRWSKDDQEHSERLHARRIHRGIAQEACRIVVRRRRINSVAWDLVFLSTYSHDAFYVGLFFLFFIKRIPNQVLFEITNTMNALLVSSAETWQTWILFAAKMWIWSSCSQCIRGVV